MDLKDILKKIKLNEDNISMVLGVLVIVVTGILVVNYFRNLNTSNLFKTGGNAAATTNSQIEAKHTVAKGESLWKIAESYYGDGYKWTEIAKANNLKNPSSIEVGQELTLPDIKTETAMKDDVKSSDTKSVQTLTGSEPITGATYEVVKGDSLWKIAVRAYGDGYQWVKIAHENKLTHPNLIHPGNLLALPR